MHHLLMEFPDISGDDTPTKRDYFTIISFIDMLLQKLRKLTWQKNAFSVLLCVQNLYGKIFQRSYTYKNYTVKALSVLPYVQNLYVQVPLQCSCTNKSIR